jgi:hypothetical protein
MLQPLVQQIVEAAYGTDLSLEISISEALDEPTPCESTVHSQGTLGHDPSQSASYFFIPACGCSRLMCKAWVDNAFEHFTRYQCSRTYGCGESTELADAVVIPLDTTL